LTPDEQFVQAAIGRMYRWMAAFAVATTVVLLVWKGGRHAGGFALGAALSILNFRWLKAGVEMLTTAFGQSAGGDSQAPPPDSLSEPVGEAASAAERNRPLSSRRVPASRDRGSDVSAKTAADSAGGSVARATRRKRAAVLFRFLLRYALIVAAAYVIFRSSVLSLTAFLGGLFVFVAGVLAEMIYELATGTGATD